MKDLGLKRGWVITTAKERRRLSVGIEIIPWAEVASGHIELFWKRLHIRGGLATLDPPILLKTRKRPFTLLFQKLSSHWKREAGRDFWEGLSTTLKWYAGSNSDTGLQTSDPVASSRLPFKKRGLGRATGNWKPGTPLKAGLGLLSEPCCLNHRRASIFLDLSKIFLYDLARCVQ
jgi:hypothetical protein